jgi:hypothetical protein
VSNPSYKKKFTSMSCYKVETISCSFNKRGSSQGNFDIGMAVEELDEAFEAVNAASKTV